jgi:hypothetical protein
MRLLEAKVRNRFTTLDLLNRLGRLGVVLAGLLAGPAGAQSSGSADSSGSPLWEVGFAAFGLTQQAWPGASEEVQRAGIGLQWIWMRSERSAID